MKELFCQPYDYSDPLWVIFGYFDRMYDDGYFIDAISNLIERTGFSVDGAYCNFPEPSSPFEEEHFDGVEFAYGCPPDEDSIIVQEKIFYDVLKNACAIYIKKHPAQSKRITTLLSKLE